jgi:hypothetical protein
MGVIPFRLGQPLQGRIPVDALFLFPQIEVRFLQIPRVPEWCQIMDTFPEIDGPLLQMSLDFRFHEIRFLGVPRKIRNPTRSCFITCFVTRASERAASKDREQKGPEAAL